MNPRRMTQKVLIMNFSTIISTALFSARRVAFIELQKFPTRTIPSSRQGGWLHTTTSDSLLLQDAKVSLHSIFGGAGVVLQSRRMKTSHEGLGAEPDWLAKWLQVIALSECRASSCHGCQWQISQPTAWTLVSSGCDRRLRGSAAWFHGATALLQRFFFTLRMSFSPPPIPFLLLVISIQTCTLFNTLLWLLYIYICIYIYTYSELYTYILVYLYIF